jgi:hypothetical protein
LQCAFFVGVQDVLQEKQLEIRGGHQEINQNPLGRFPRSPGSAEEIISALLSSDTLAEIESGYEFRYGYIYHYFSALYFSRTLDFERVKRLFANLDNEEYANITLFLTHLSNDAFVLDQIAHNV